MARVSESRAIEIPRKREMEQTVKGINADEWKALGDKLQKNWEQKRKTGNKKRKVVIRAEAEEQ